MDSLPMLTRSWWILALRGALAVLFGIFALAMPDVTLLSLIALFAIYAVLAGAVAIAGAIRSRRTSRDWWILLLLGIVSVGAGLLAALRPGLTALALVIVIAVNALLNGALDIALAVRLRKFIEGEWLLMLSAATSIAFGLLILLYPGAGALALVWIIGVYALLLGALYLTLAYRGRRTAGGARPIDGAAG
jgi:uncharacterized membrane protein HdeD (DUF308 family)